MHAKTKTDDQTPAEALDATLAQDDEAVSLAVLQREVDRYLDLYGVFEPGEQTSGNSATALEKISTELTDMLSSALHIAAARKAETLADLRAKVDICTAVLELPTLPVRQTLLVRVLQSVSIDTAHLDTWDLTDTQS